MFGELHTDLFSVGRTCLRDDKVYIVDCMDGHCVNGKDVHIVNTRIPLGQSVL
jgi:hypothetical protein